MVLELVRKKRKKRKEMNETKPAIKSLGFWGSLSAIGGSLGLIKELLAIYNSIDPAQIADIVSKGSAAYFAVAALVGAIASLIGRLKAKKQITNLFKSN